MCVCPRVSVKRLNLNRLICCALKVVNDFNWLEFELFYFFIFVLTVYILNFTSLVRCLNERKRTWKIIWNDLIITQQQHFICQESFNHITEIRPSNKMSIKRLTQIHTDKMNLCELPMLSKCFEIMSKGVIFRYHQMAATTTTVSSTREFITGRFQLLPISFFPLSCPFSDTQTKYFAHRFVDRKAEQESKRERPKFKWTSKRKAKRRTKIYSKH